MISNILKFSLRYYSTIIINTLSLNIFVLSFSIKLDCHFFNAYGYWWRQRVDALFIILYVILLYFFLKLKSFFQNNISNESKYVIMCILVFSFVEYYSRSIRSARIWLVESKCSLKVILFYRFYRSRYNFNFFFFSGKKSNFED